MHDGREVEQATLEVVEEEQDHTGYKRAEQHWKMRCDDTASSNRATLTSGEIGIVLRHFHRFAVLRNAQQHAQIVAAIQSSAVPNVADDDREGSDQSQKQPFEEADFREGEE